ncbi:hypothetical protein ACET3Z_008235 [Daucus carota]
MQAQDAIDYGVADKTIDSRNSAFEKWDYDSILVQSKAMRGRTAGNPQATPSGFRWSMIAGHLDGKNKRSSKAQKILPSDKKLLEIPEDCGLKVQIEPPTPLMEESLGDILFSEQWGLQLELGFMDWPNEDNAIMQKGCRTLRILTFYSTQFPGPNYHCRENNDAF